MKTIRLKDSTKVAHVDNHWYPVLKEYLWYEESSTNTSYAYRRITKPDGTPAVLYMHQMIMPLEENDDRIIDHKNGNGLNNLETNLRPATWSQNQANRTLNVNSKTHYKGVTNHRASGKFQAHASRDRQLVFLGLFIIAVEAAIAYNIAATALHGEFAHPNVIPPEQQPEPKRAEEIRSQVIAKLTKKKLLAP